MISFGAFYITGFVLGYVMGRNDEKQLAVKASKRPRK